MEEESVSDLFSLISTFRSNLFSNIFLINLVFHSLDWVEADPFPFPLSAYMYVKVFFNYIFHSKSHSKHEHKIGAMEYFP